MALKSSTSLALFLGSNLVLFSLVSAYYPSEPTPSPTPTYYQPKQVHHRGPFCPKNVLKLGVCAKVLDALVLHIGIVPTDPSCCPLIEGLTDLEAAVCLCTIVNANVLGVQVDAKVFVELLLNYCGYGYPHGYKCAP